MSETAAASAFPKLSYAWFVVAVLLLALVLSFVDRQILSLMVQPVRADLHLSDTRISLLVGAAFTLFYVLLGLPLGRLADRGHRQRLIVTGVLVWSMATVCCGLANSFVALFAARLVVGVGEAALSPAAYSLIADYFAPAQRARAMSIYALGPIAGTGLALILGGQAVAATAHAHWIAIPLIGRVHGWQAAFFIVGLPGLAIVALLTTVREPRRQQLAAARSGSDPAQATKGRGTTLALISIGSALSGSVVAFGFGAWLPTAFVRLHGWTAPQIASAMGLILLIGGVGGAVGGGFLADRLTAHGRPAGALMLLSIGAAGVIPAAPIISLAGPWLALAAYGWLNVFLGMATALAMPSLQAITRNQSRGQVAAIYLLTVTVIGLGFGPTLIALATDKLFASDLAVGKSMALVITISATIGLGLLLLARRRYSEFLLINEGRT